MTDKNSTSPTPKKKQAKKKAVTGMSVYLITPKRDGFRRAGRAWPGTTTTVDADALSAEQLQQLRDDPMFDVQEGVVD